MKYYIKKTNKRTGKTEYKRYKCIDGFTPCKSICWQFSRQGALRIVESLKREYWRNLDNLEFELEAAKED